MFQRKKPYKGLHNDDEDAEITTHKKRYISPKERQQIIDELRLVPKKDPYFQKLIDELMLTLKRCTYLKEM